MRNETRDEAVRHIVRNSRVKATPEVLAKVEELLDARDAAKSTGTREEYRNAWNAVSEYVASNLPQKRGGRGNVAGRRQYNARRAGS